HGLYLPMIINGAPRSNGNWELTMIDAIASIGVYLDAHATFDKAMGIWRKRVPAYLYLKSDAPTPVPPPGTSMNRKEVISYWQGQSTSVDGLAQETCRDPRHTGWGIEAADQPTEPARLQRADRD